MQCHAVSQCNFNFFFCKPYFYFLFANLAAAISMHGASKTHKKKTINAHVQPALILQVPCAARLGPSQPTVASAQISRRTAVKTSRVNNGRVCYCSLSTCFTASSTSSKTPSDGRRSRGMSSPSVYTPVRKRSDLHALRLAPWISDAGLSPTM